MFAPSWFHLCRSLVGIETPTLSPAAGAGADVSVVEDVSVVDVAVVVVELLSVVVVVVVVPAFPPQPASIVTESAAPKKAFANFFILNLPPFDFG